MSSTASMPRIGIDVTSALTQGGGIGRYTRELVRALAKSDYDNVYILFSAKQPARLPVPDPLPVGPNVEHRMAPLSEQWLYRLWYRLHAPVPVQWFTGQIDLFHSPDFVLPSVQGNIPTLLTVHDLSFVHFPETFPEALVKYLNQVVPRSVRKATQVLADSQATRDDLVQIWNVPFEKISVLYSGVSRKFQPINDKKRLRGVRTKYRLEDRPYILSVGTVQPRKNLEMLLDAFKPVADSSPHNLVIAGAKGWFHDRIVEKVSSLELNQRIRFLGFVDDDDLPALYSEATLFVFPSIYEGFGLPLLEAMACGVPVITSNASSLPEVVGDAAIQLPPLEPILWTKAMLDLLTNGTKRAQYVAAGFLQSRQYSWDRAAGQLSSIYKALLSS